MLKKKKIVFLFLGLGLIPAFLLACGGDDGDGNDTAASATAQSTATAGNQSGDAPNSITVNLKNWAVEPSSETAAAGTVTFRATHEEEGHGGHGADEAGATHQLVVARLEDGAEVGQSKFGRPVLNLADIKVGEEKTGEAVLEPGKYELSCLVVEEVDGEVVNHYEEGMYALLTVE